MEISTITKPIGINTKYGIICEGALLIGVILGKTESGRTLMLSWGMLISIGYLTLSPEDVIIESSIVNKFTKNFLNISKIIKLNKIKYILYETRINKNLCN